MAEGDAGLEGLEGLDEELDRLYAGPPGEFTAERDRLAKALRKDGEKERAAAVGRLRRPTRLAAALNTIARADPTGLGRLIEASARLAEAQEDVLKGRGDAAGLRDAERAEREALEPLIAGAGDDASALAAALRAGARSPAGREPLRRGWLSREPEPDAGGLFAMGAPPARQLAREETPEATPPRRQSTPTREPEPEPDPETPARLERAKEALDAARAAAEEAEAEHAGAEAAAGEAAEVRRAAEEARDAARAAAEESARRAAEDAERAEAAARAAEEAGERAEAEEARAKASAERRDAAREALAAAEAAARDAIAAAEGRRGA